MPERYDIAVDFMDMTNDRRLWVRPVDVRSGLSIEIGHHVVVGDDDADPRVARVVEIDGQGNIELQALPGSVESHAELLTPAS
ncbi:MAG: hypothetical protein AB7W59_25035 [Acidimicrobiia bacterium]